MPAITSSTAARITGTATSLTVAHPVSSGDVLYVTVCSSFGGAVSSVTYGGVALTGIVRDTTGFNRSLEWWASTTPTAGLANVVVTMGSAVVLAVVARSVSGVDTAILSRNFVAAAGFWNGSSGNPALTATSASGDLVLDCITMQQPSQSYTPGGGQVLDVAQNGVATNDETLAASHAPGAASVALSWALTQTGSWLHTALSVPPDAVAVGIETAQPYVWGPL